MTFSEHGNEHGNEHGGQRGVERAGERVRYARPASVDAAAALLAAGEWSLLAGGTDLYPAHVGRPLSLPLLDLGGIAELRGIRRDGDGWSIGATTTWTDVLRADLPPRFDALKQAAREVGGAQIQNAGTVIGNLCNASPAADGIPVLLALDAEVILRGARGERRVRAVEFVHGSRRTACAADEIVVALRIPAATASSVSRSVFLKLGGRRHLAISMTMVAVVIYVDRHGVIAHGGVAVGSCSACAQRLPSLEQKLVGSHADADLAMHVGNNDLAPLAPIDDLRASAAYRRDATATLLRRALARLRA